MKIDHIAVWTTDIERLKNYYVNFFGAVSNDIYINKETGFSSYFLSFDSGARLEIMHRNDIPENLNDTIKQYLGYIHIALWVETEEEVDAKLELLRNAGYPILRGPRVSGDGYYEFETLDPDKNRLEVVTMYKGKR